MISVVVCTREQDICADQRSNIEETIGADLEIIAIDNSADTETIFTAYNKGVRHSKGDILCFMHDDVRFRTKDWGGIIQNLFEEDEKLGLIGFAGAHFLPDAPMYWDVSPFISEHNLTTRKGQTEKCFSLEHFGQNPLAEVVAIDGMCFFVRQSLFDRIAFDETTYKVVGRLERVYVPVERESLRRESHDLGWRERCKYDYYKGCKQKCHNQDSHSFAEQVDLTITHHDHPQDAPSHAGSRFPAIPGLPGWPPEGCS